MWEGPLGDVYDHVLQDANYNVMAHAYANATPASGVRHQFRYHPYGQWTYENAGGGETVTTNTNSRLHATHGWQGLWFDQESGLIYNRGRYYDPISGRFLSRDPNGQALILAQVRRMNAQTPVSFANFDAAGNYVDGLNPYAGLSSNPIAFRDPTGTFSTLETTVGIGVIGFLSGAVGDALFNPDSDWRSQLTGGAAGALGGAVLAWAGTASLAAVVAVGMADGMIYGASKTALNGGSLKEVLANAAASAALGGITAGVIGKFLQTALRPPVGGGSLPMWQMSAQKAAMAESAATTTLARAGYLELPARLPGNRGFDGVFVRYGFDGAIDDIIITESKFSSAATASLRQTHTMGRQLDRRWIDANIDNMINSADLAIRNTGELLRRNIGLVRTKMNVMSPDMINRWH